MNINIDISNIELQTNRLLLRPWRESDLDDFFEYASVDGVGQMAGWKPHQSKEESKEILKRFIDGKKTFAIVYDNKTIGSVGIEEYKDIYYPNFEKYKARELGFVLSKAYWGKGIMAEGVKEVIRYLFEDVGLDVIFCKHYKWNKQSASVQAKCGFKFYRNAISETIFETKEESICNILWKEDWLKDN